MGCDANAMAVFLKLVAEGYKRLDIAPAADNLDDDVETEGPFSCLAVLGWRCLCVLPFVGDAGVRGNKKRKPSTEFRIEIDLNAAVIR